MTGLVYLFLTLVSGFGVGALLYVKDPRVMLVLLTAWLWTAVYGSTYYQTKWTMRLFRQRKC